MDPLANLHDIQTPEAISTFPIAIGWWLLALTLITLVIFIIVRIKRSKALKQKQKQAIKALADTQSNQELIKVLKWAAMAYFPRQHVAQLHSQQLQTFLTSTLPAKKQATFTDLCDSQFANLYQANQVLAPSLKEAAMYWLTHALPTSPSKGEQHV